MTRLELFSKVLQVLWNRSQGKRITSAILLTCLHFARKLQAYVARKLHSGFRLATPAANCVFLSRVRVSHLYQKQPESLVSMRQRTSAYVSSRLGLPPLSKAVRIARKERQSDSPVSKQTLELCIDVLDVYPRFVRSQVISILVCWPGNDTQTP